ncbi:hypothetical protein [Sphingobacterium lumbrici]|uniref:hypothetical protein n=1 Tax=Sphingobacterium lumbrici TaxID=2559600 RepID=UPI0011276E79|nr:hypothetical protein [Sphingobacterium lumbrici]
MKEINTYHDELGGNKFPESLRVNPFSIPPDYFSVQESVILSLVKLEKLEIQKNNLVTPEGYFKKLQDNILAKVAEQKLKNQVGSTGFEVPQHYFEESAHQIQATIFKETLRKQVTTAGFTTPVDYIEAAKESILNRIAEEQLKTIVNHDGYEVPAAYFETLEQDILSTVAVEKLKAEVTETGYDVPAGYFDLLSEKTFMIPGNTNSNERTMKVLDGHLEQLPPAKQDETITRLPSWKRWTSYAAAVAAIIGIASYLSFNQQNNAIYSDNISLSEIPGEEIISYLAQVSDGNDLIIFSEYLEIPEKMEIGSQIEDNDIEEYLNYML